MTNQTINLKNLCSGIGLFSTFLIFNGYELKAESLSSSDKKYLASNKIKWVRYDEFYRDKGIEFIKKDTHESNNQLITKIKKEEILENKEFNKRRNRGVRPRHKNGLSRTRGQETRTFPN